MKKEPDDKKRIRELEERIQKLEEWFTSEIKRKDKIIENLERERELFRSAAIKEAEQREQAASVMEKLKKKIEQAGGQKKIKTRKNTPGQSE